MKTMGTPKRAIGARVAPLLLAIVPALVARPGMAIADPAPVMVSTRTGCRTIDDVLAIMRLADRSERQGGDLSAAQSVLDARLGSGACRVIKQGMPVAVVERQDRESFPFVCLKPDGDAACYWISSFPTRMP